MPFLKKWLLYPFLPFIVFHLKFFFMCDYDISRKMLTKFCVSNFIFTREKLKNMIFLILKMSTLHTALLTMPIKAIGKAVFKFCWCTLFYILSLRGRNGINHAHKGNWKSSFKILLMHVILHFILEGSQRNQSNSLDGHWTAAFNIQHLA